MKKKIWLIKKLEGYEPNTDAPIPIYTVIGFTSKLSILHHIAILNKRCADCGWVGVHFITEKVSSISIKGLEIEYNVLHQYETC